MDRRQFLKGFGAGAASLSLPTDDWSETTPVTSGFSGSCKIIGIGGAGTNITLALRSSAVLESANMQPEFICLDLGLQALKYVDAANDAVPEQPPIKAMALAPFGAGGRINAARAAALHQREALSAMLADTDVVILLAGLGGGTGSGLTPIMARLARAAGALTVAAVVTPFEYEGVRNQKADAAIRYLDREADVMMTFSNEAWAARHDEEAPMIDVFNALDRHIAASVRTLLDRASQGRC